MATSTSIVNIKTDSIQDWLTKTDTISYKLSTEVVTANSATGVTTGNAYVNGVFSANTLAIVANIRGGTVATANVLNISSNVLQQNVTLTVSGLVSCNASANQVIDSFALTTSRSSKYLLQVNTAVGYQSTEILVLHDGSTNVFSTEYATLSTNGIQGVFSVNIASSNVNLLITPSPAVSTVSFQRTSLQV